MQALNDSDFSQFKSVIKASGESSYKYLQNIYSNHYTQNQAVSIAIALSEMILKDKGVCRVHGGGFAGTIQVLLKIAMLKLIKKKLKNILVKEHVIF